jgi:Cys-tRNA(Pro)/Cys-tRNA(Cys) deacylase
MTPAINAAKKAKISCTVHQYDHDPTVLAYGKEAADKLGLAAERVFKTLIVELDGKVLATAILPVSAMLSMKLLAKAAGVKKADMADKSKAEKSTGYVLGGISPLGQKRRLPTYLDQSALNFPTIFVSAGRRGVDLELAPTDLKTLTTAVVAAISESP